MKNAKKNFLKNFSKSWPKRLTSNGVFSKKEKENPFPAAKEDDALKLPWNQKESVRHIFDSYCKKILRQETRICSGQRCAAERGSVTFRSCPRSFLRSFAPRTFTPWSLKRDVILLSYFMDMSDREIGELLDMARRTVQHRRTDTLAELRKRMEDDDD